MKRIVIMMIEEGKTPSTKVDIFSNESANISINAPTMGEALTLLKGAEEEAETMTKSIVIVAPDRRADAPEKGTTGTGNTQERKASFEDTPKGSKFIKGLQEAQTFTEKNCKGGLCASELDYLYRKHQNSLFSLSWDIFCYAYKYGYDKGSKKRADKK